MGFVSKATVDKFGGLDIVVCNAGVLGNKDMLNLSIKTYDLLQSINARGAYVTCKVTQIVVRSLFPQLNHL